MYVIAGVTGNTGSATANALLAKGEKVRVLVRNAAAGAAWAKKGAEVAVGDLSDPKALGAALKGAKGVFVLSPPNFAAAGTAAGFIEDRLAFGKHLAAGLEAAKVPSVVLLSSVAAHQPSGTGPIVTTHNLEGLLKGIAPSVTFVRAAYFLDNWAGMVGLAQAQGILPFFGDVNARFPQVAAADIGAAVASALLHPADGTRVVELAGQQDWSASDVAQALGGLLGRPVQAVSAPLAAATGELVKAGLPQGMAELFAEMYAGIASGVVAFQGAPTRGSTSLRDALSRHVKA